MPGSGRSIDYRVRIRKQIERRMLLEALSHLGRKKDLSEYQYVGFGSFYFVDFSLIHRHLGVMKMTSLECSGQDARTAFNRPFDCIELLHEPSHRGLQKLQWDRPSIVWLDYDDKLNNNKLKDLSFLARTLVSGSVILLTLCVQSAFDPLDNLKHFKDNIDKEYKPKTYKKDDLTGNGFAKESRILVKNVLDGNVLKNKSSGRDVRWRQFANFRYADGTKMISLGWLLEEDGENVLEDTGISTLPYFRDGENQFHINPPLLTPKEVRHLNAQLPNSNPIECDGISEDDCVKYAELYRYYPAYFEVFDY